MNGCDVHVRMTDWLGWGARETGVGRENQNWNRMMCGYRESDA